MVMLEAEGTWPMKLPVATPGYEIGDVCAKIEDIYT
jgi:hypothetical protein